jgi:hypothetical protein
MRKIDVRIDFRVNDRYSSVRALMNRLSRAELAVLGCEPHTIHIDLSRCDYLGPDAASLLARFCFMANDSKTNIVVQPPQAPAELRNYWIYSGLSRLFFPSTATPPEDKEHRVLPIRQFTEAKFTDSDDVVNLIKYHQKLSVDLEEYLRVCINEVVQNVKDHAQSPAGAVMAGRYMRKSKEVRIAVVDAGKGICKTLKPKYPDTTPELALRRVLRGGYSAMSRVNNLGLGISNLCNIVSKQLNGDIFLVSDRAVLEIQKGRKPNIRSLDFTFHGTAAFFTLPVVE